MYGAAHFEQRFLINFKVVPLVNVLTTFDRTRDGKIVAAFRLEKDDLQPQNETWSSKRSVNCRRLSHDNTENHAAASVLPLTRRFRKHESARASPVRTFATPTASITSGARREASTAANWSLGHGRASTTKYKYGY